MKIVSLFFVVCISMTTFPYKEFEFTTHQTRRVKMSVDTKIYQAIWALNISLVSTLLSEYESLTALEKEQLLDIARYRANLCGQKRISISEKVEKIVSGVYLLLGALIVFRIRDIKNRVSNSFLGSISIAFEKINAVLKHFNLIEAHVVSYLSSMPLLIALASSLVALSTIKFYSVLVAMGNDQDAQQAEEIVKLISVIPVRN